MQSIPICFDFELIQGQNNISQLTVSSDCLQQASGLKFHFHLAPSQHGCRNLFLCPHIGL